MCVHLQQKWQVPFWGLINRNLNRLSQSLYTLNDKVKYDNDDGGNDFVEFSYGHWYTFDGSYMEAVCHCLLPGYRVLLF